MIFRGFREFWCSLTLILFGSLVVSVSFASDYGTSGLIDIPTARFDPDGYLSVAASTDQRHNQFSISYQATPWLQGTFRYTGFNDFFYWDRNYEIKAKLLDETTLIPQLAIGIRDIVGTGIFGSEYFVASKRIKNWDYTLGVGWGRLAGKGGIQNPLGSLDGRFEVRPGVSAAAGEFALGNLFSGEDIGLFGGVAYSLKSAPIEMVLEYNPDQYDWDVQFGGKRPKTPLSLGLTWNALPGVDLWVSAQHGNEIGFGFKTYLDSKQEFPRRAPNQFISSFYLPPNALPSQINKNSWYDRLLFDVERSGLLLIEGSVSDEGQHAELVIGNTSYALWSDAIGQHTALADLHLPATVRSIHFVVEEAGHRTATIVVPRPSTTFNLDRRGQRNQIRTLSGRTLRTPQYKTSFVTGKINSTINLRSRFQLFDPDDPARYQVYADLSSELALSNYWAVRSSIAINIDQNFSESRRQNSDSVIRKVRSDVVKYLNEGDSGLEKLIIEGRSTVGRNIHYRAYAGYLETMYAGFGGEVLYWPNKSRVAFGVSAAMVKQRDFDRSFGLLDYEVFTGHLSTYWASPFYNFDVALHAGRYLARDLGVTMEARRTFRNGWQVGVWASLTDVPFDDFGEGAFDKGLYFQIPLDSIFGSRTRGAFSTRMRPIQRDGGQRLEGFSGDIFWDVRSARYDAFYVDNRLLP